MIFFEEGGLWSHICMSQLQAWESVRDNCYSLAVRTLQKHTCLWLWAGPGQEEPRTSVTCCIRKRSHLRVGVGARSNQYRGKKKGSPLAKGRTVWLSKEYGCSWWKFSGYIQTFVMGRRIASPLPNVHNLVPRTCEYVSVTWQESIKECRYNSDSWCTDFTIRDY